MSALTVHIINAFVDGETGGNPAGVVLDADRLSREQRQHVAAAVGHSETAFVSRSEVADYKLEFFTPTRRIPHCGHATIAAFSHLAQTGRIQSKQSSDETVDGVRRIVLDGAKAFMEQGAPLYEDPQAAGVTAQAVTASLGLRAGDLLPGHTPLVGSTGNRFLLIPVAERESLQRARPDLAAIARISDTLDVVGYYAFTLEAAVAGRAAAARMFAPRFGIPEESATGMAAGPLAGYLHNRLAQASESFLIEQGRFTTPPSPSLLEVRLSFGEGVIQSLMVGGRARAIGEISVDL